MSGQSFAGALLLATALSLSGCGISYVSPLVNQRSTQDDVNVVPISRESLALANSSPYATRALPDVFSQLAGGGALRGAGALPEPPTIPDLSPGQLELRLPPPETPGPYRIGVGDVVQLATRSASGTTDQITGSVSGEEIRQQYTVRDDGAIALPEVGTVQIGGLTIEEAEQQLFERIISSGSDPDFSLEIAEFNARLITIGGAVGNPINLAVGLNVPTLDEALTSAGGIQVDTPEYASIRLYRNGTLYQIPLETYRDRGDLRSIQLLPGDSIFVDTSYDLDRALAYYEQQINITSLRRGERISAINELQAEIGLRRAALSEQRELFTTRDTLSEENSDFVYLAGEVGNQGRYELPYGRRATLADALFADGAGVETQTGNPSQIYVLRLSDDPSQEPVTAWHLDARNAANLTLATRFELRPNDIIFVEEQPITRWNRAFQQFFPVLLGQARSLTGD